VCAVGVGSVEKLRYKKGVSRKVCKLTGGVSLPGSPHCVEKKRLTASANQPGTRNSYGERNGSAVLGLQIFVAEF
jgi:hypothetical protein